MSLRLAIVGCGLMTQQTHLPAAARSKALEVTALVDPDLGRAQALAAEYAVARVGRRRSGSCASVQPRAQYTGVAGPQ